ncbi:MAG: hypothetical protein EKK64_09240 [Neisseriaceae bacterium]|nr:MAG: hypothetical protein EKK64_09240 [Neisseriaceae bacterium]
MKKFHEFVADRQMQSNPDQALNPIQTKSEKDFWKATKPEILEFWKKLRSDSPILMKPIEYNHKGSTYGEDGIRITGSPQFIQSVLARLKEFLNFESPQTKLSVSYRETQSPSASQFGNTKTSYVFYLQTKKRGEGA